MAYTGKMIVTTSFYILLLSLCGCGSGQNQNRKNNPNSDPFYMNEKGPDFNRFPLIKPYEVITLNRGEE
jgi:hypothetical protein